MQSDSYRSDKCSIIAPRCDHVQYLNALFYRTVSHCVSKTVISVKYLHICVFRFFPWHHIVKVGRLLAVVLCKCLVFCVNSFLLCCALCVRVFQWRCVPMLCWK